MKYILLILAFCASIHSFAQGEYNYTSFNKLTIVEGTSNVIATVKQHSKMAGNLQSTSSLLFINTETGDTTQVSFPKGGSFSSFEQIKIDSFGINQILVVAKTVDLDNKKGIDWNDPTQIIAISPNGKKRVQLTDDNFFPQTWLVVKETGRLVVSGHYDSNNNGKYDTSDKTEISIFDLKSLKLLRKI